MPKDRNIPQRIGISALLTEAGRSGIGQYTYKLIENLLQVDPFNQYIIFALKGDQTLKTFKNNNLKIIFVSNPFRSPLVSIFWHLMVLPILLKWQKVDVLHLPTDRRLPLWSPCPIVVTTHDFAALHNPNKYGLLRYFYIKHFVVNLIKRASHIICVSHSTRDDLKTLLPENKKPMSVVYNGLDHKLYVPLDKIYCQTLLTKKYGISFPFLLCVARLEHPGKNHIRLIRAFSTLKKTIKFPQRLVLIGAPWNGVEEIYQEVKDSDSSSDIIFPGFIPTHDLPLFYNAADLFILPSLWEGFGLPILEAMACGTPVACSRVGSLPEVGGNVAHFFNPLDEKDIEASIRKILQNSHALTMAKSEGQQWALKFSWETTAKETLDIYQATSRLDS